MSGIIYNTDGPDRKGESVLGVCSERHYLWLLLHHMPGATSFADLRKTPDGITHKTFKEAALAFGLLESDEEWNECLSEASVSFMPKQL